MTGPALAPGPTALLAQALVTDLTLEALARILGLALLAGAAAAGTALIYRWYAADPVPDGIAALVGVTLVALWLNTQSALGDAIIGETPLLDSTTAVYTLGAFASAAVASDAGRRLGDRVATDVLAVAAPESVDDVSQFVRAAGRVVAVELPETVADVDGYDPVDGETRAALAGRTLLVPRRLDRAGVRDRLTERIERDYGVGRVDLEIGDDGRTVEYLAVGSRPAGLGPSLAPGSVAVPIRADPGPDASPGDSVVVWAASGDSVEPVGRAELRGTAGDVATIAVDEEEAGAFEREDGYRLVTLPGASDAGRELVSVLRASDETVAAVSIERGDRLEGAAVGHLPAAVLAIDRGGRAVALPDDDRTVEAGDVVYVVGRPAAVSRLESDDPDLDGEARADDGTDGPDRRWLRRRG